MANKACVQKHWRVVASTTPRLLLLITTFLFLLLVGTRVANRITFAGNTVGSFEIDGNLTVDHLVQPSEPIDWDSSPFLADLPLLTYGPESNDDIFVGCPNEMDNRGRDGTEVRDIYVDIVIH